MAEDRDTLKAELKSMNAAFSRGDLPEPRTPVARLIRRMRRALAPQRALELHAIQLAGRIAARDGRTRQAAFLFVTAYRRAISYCAGNSLRVATLSSIAGLFFNSNRYAAAELCLRKALAVAAGDRKISGRDLARLQFNLGTTIRHLGRPGEAIDALEACLSFRSAEADTRPLELVHVLTELAEAVGWFQDPSAGRVYFQQAVAAMERVSEADRERGRRYLDSADLHLLVDEGDYAAALLKVELLAARDETSPDNVWSRARCLAGLRRWNEALSLLDSLIDGSPESGSGDEIATEARNGRYKVRRAVGDREGALNDLRVLLMGKHSILSKHTLLSTDVLPPGFGTVLLTQLWEYLDLIGPGRVEGDDAWALFDLVASYKNNWREMVAARAAERGLRRAIIDDRTGAALKHLYEAEFAKPPAPAANAQAAISPRPDLALGELFVDVLVHAPCIATDQFERGGPSYWGPKGYVLCAYRPDWPCPRVLHLENGEAVDGQLSWLRDQTQTPNPNRAHDTSCQPLLPSDWLDGLSRVYLRGDSRWHATPLDATTLDDGTPVLDRISLHLVSHTRDIAHRSVRLRDAGAPIVIANPDYSGVPSSPESGVWIPPNSVYLLSALRRLNVRFTPLLDTSEESAILQSAFGEALIYEKDRARGDVVLHGANAVVLHIATHAGFLDPSLDDHFFHTSVRGSAATPLDPGGTTGRVYVVFAGVNRMLADPTAVFDPGALLTAETISERDLSKVTLVVLSACESGLGHPVPGEGVVGLPQAFLCAGADVVVHSLWPVGGEGVHTLMRSFYHRLLQGLPVGQSLAEAKRHLRRRGAPSHIWAAFQCLGAVNTILAQ